MYIDNFYLNMNRTVKKSLNCNKYHTKCNEKKKFHRTLPIIFQNFQIYTKAHLKLSFYLKNNFTQFSKKYEIS